MYKRSPFYVGSKLSDYRLYLNSIMYSIHHKYHDLNNRALYQFCIIISLFVWKSSKTRRCLFVKLKINVAEGRWSPEHVSFLFFLSPTNQIHFEQSVCVIRFLVDGNVKTTSY